MDLALLYITALALTLAIELPICAYLLPGPKRQRLWDGLLANLVSHPLASFAVWQLTCPWWLAELAVVAIEASIFEHLSGLTRAKAWQVALLINTLTAALSGLFL